MKLSMDNHIWLMELAVWLLALFGLFMFGFAVWIAIRQMISEIYDQADQLLDKIDEFLKPEQDEDDKHKG